MRVQFFTDDFNYGNVLFLVCHVTLCDFMRNMWLHGCFFFTINHQLVKFHDHRSCQRGYVTLLVYHMTTHHHIVRGSCDSYHGVPITISTQTAMFGGYRPCGMGDIKFSICHLTSGNHVIRGSYDIVDEFPSS